MESVLYNSQFTTNTSAYALYGQVEYNPPILDDRLTLTAGLRYSNESKRGGRFEKCVILRLAVHP